MLGGIDEQGWAGYTDERVEGIGAIGSPGFAYVPDLAPVGSGSQGTYYPRDTSQDAAALNFLGFYPDPLLAAHVGTTGTQRGDMAANAGAWDETFQVAVEDFQDAAGLVNDGWIGPATRSALAAAVASKNARGGTPGAVLPSLPGSPGVPGVTPVGAGGRSPAKDNTLLFVGLGAGALVLGGVLYTVIKG